MAELTPDRLAKLRRIAAELRRIAAETTPGTYEWRIIETAMALTIETALALLDRIEALEDMLLRLYQDTVVPDTHYCHRCGVIGGHDESCAMAEVEVLLGLTGGATHA